MIDARQDFHFASNEMIASEVRHCRVKMRIDSRQVMKTFDETSDVYRSVLKERYLLLFFTADLC